MEIYLMAKTKNLKFKVQNDLIGEKTISVNSLLEGHRHLRAHKWLEATYQRKILINHRLR